MNRRAVFLDRDGVINRAIIRDGKPYPPRNLDELEILDGAQEAINILSKANFMLIVITNQPDVARGIIEISKVDEINNYLMQCLPIDEFRTCYHDDSDYCNCRKPLPGSLLSAAKRYDIDLQKSYMIGDRWRDIEAGRMAGCKTIFIDYEYSESRPNCFDYCVKSLNEAALLILEETV